MLIRLILEQRLAMGAIWLCSLAIWSSLAIWGFLAKSSLALGLLWP